MKWGLQDVRVSRGGNLALAGVTVPVDPSRITAVVGDGAGKSSCLDVLVGLLEPDAGTVRRPPKERLGYVPATAGLYPDLTVQENLDFSARAYRLSGREYRQKSGELLERTLALAAHATGSGGQLSGGMQRKLAVGMALLHAPELLVLDEPTTGVDPVSRAELWRLISGAAADGTAVAVTTTYVNEAARAVSVVLLDSGKVAASGSPARSAKRPRRARHQRGAERPDSPVLAARRQLARVGSGRQAPRRRPAGSAWTSKTPWSRPPWPASRGGNAMDVLTEARQVTRRFGPFTAVSGVDLVVRRGEVVGLLGANGAGKTTLIRLLLGLLRPSDGMIRLFGAAPSIATRRRVGYVPQTLGLYSGLTVAENWKLDGGGVPREGCPDCPASYPRGRKNWSATFRSARNARSRSRLPSPPARAAGPRRTHVGRRAPQQRTAVDSARRQ